MNLAEREAHLRDLLEQSNAMIDAAIEEFFTASGHERVATVILYSGGNDSTTLAHAFRHRADYAAHCNTGIGIERTRQFVRDTCLIWRLPLIEVHAPVSYEELVIDQGFPGPGHHYKMYQRLKERGLRQVRRQLVQNPRRQRVLFLAGRRRDESQRRMLIPECDRDGSMVFVSPLAHWTKEDLNTYRLVYPDVPRNEVSDSLHMSGECLCGSFAHADELDEIRFWFPDVAHEIDELERKVRATGRHPEWKCQWGWGANKDLIKKLKAEGMDDKAIAALFDRSQSGLMCSSCAARAEEEGIA